MSGTYDSYRVPALWRMVVDENSANNTAHESAWAQKQTLLNSQIANLRSLREQVTACWDPATSVAAQRFIDELDQMIGFMTTASEAAANVQRTLAAVTDALFEAKRKLEPLRESYYDSKAALRTYVRNSSPLGPLLSAVPDDRVPTMGLPDGMGNAVLGLHQNRLDEQARVIMETADRKVTEATADTVVIPSMGRYEDGAMPLAQVDQQATGGGNTSGRYVPQPAFTPPTPDGGPVGNNGPASAPDDSGLGPFLTGAPSPVVTPPVLTSPVAPATVPPTALDTGWMIQTPSGQRALRPGGVIGPRSGASVERPPSGEPDVLRSTETGPTSKVFAGPGVIGSQTGQPVARGTGKRGSSRVSATGGPTEAHEPTPPGGWRDRSYEAYARRRAGRKRDADDQWQVAEGVAPVLESPKAQTVHDAAPGVIGIDR
ncbi:hypothetical protein [Dactylosporangium sp. CA-092794]|uniref:hypothetical protein n=1 Tax=Dactylosporangium sp. CA-092794 TaxID=3239929 RepID=UPI003D940560